MLDMSAVVIPRKKLIEYQLRDGTVVLLSLKPVSSAWRISQVDKRSRCLNVDTNMTL